jgi:hypothetical protein
VSVQILLQVHAAHNRCGRLWLRQNQEVRVGRSDWSDFAVPGDPHLADEHFKVICQPEACRLVDLSRSPGTYVNGVRVVERTLADGDAIRAGRTEFAVYIDVGPRSPAPQMTAPQRTASILRCTQRRTRERMTVVQSVDSTCGLDAAIDALSSLGRAYAVVNERRLELSVTALQLPGADLLAELPDVVRAHHALWLVPYPPALASRELLASLWGRDGLTVVFSRLALDELAAHLRHAAPSFLSAALLRRQLLTAPTSFVQQLLTGLNAVLVEGEQPRSWLLFSDQAASVA